MANEISINCTVKLVNGDLNDPGPNIGTNQITQALQLLWKDVVTLTAGADTAIAPAGLTTFGICYLVNLDQTNYVEWGPDSGGAIKIVGQLNPNDSPAVFRLSPGITLRMKAHTANCKVVICIYNN